MPRRYEMLHIAFIGVGGRAKSHLQTVEATPDSEVTAVCDVDQARVKEVATAFDATAYTDHEQLYESEERLDAVFVVIPPFAHTTQETMAAERGLDLFVEKPVALDAETAATVEQTIRANDVIGAVGYQHRYAAATERAQEILDGRTVGLVEGEYLSGVPGGPDHWWRSYEHSGGQIVEQATHIYDLLRLFGGPVDEVTAVGGHELVDTIDFEDVVAANTAHGTGTVGHVTSTSASPVHSSGVEIVAEGCYLSLSGNRLTGEVDGEEVDFTGENDSTRAAGEAFLEAVRTGEPSNVRSSYDDGRRTFELTLAVEKALETGGPVSP